MPERAENQRQQPWYQRLLRKEHDARKVAFEQTHTLGSVDNPSLPSGSGYQVFSPPDEVRFRVTGTATILEREPGKLPFTKDDYPIFEFIRSNHWHRSDIYPSLHIDSDGKKRIKFNIVKYNGRFRKQDYNQELIQERVTKEPITENAEPTSNVVGFKHGDQFWFLHFHFTPQHRLAMTKVEPVILELLAE